MDYLNISKNFNLESEILTFLISHFTFSWEPFLTLTLIPTETQHHHTDCNSRARQMAFSTWILVEVADGVNPLQFLNSTEKTTFK